MKGLIASIISFLFCKIIIAQPNPGYWQQQANYNIEVAVNTNNYKYKGTQEIEYVNNSPDTLKQLFIHLYFNAFQPNSEMDVRSRTIKDPDARVGDRISKLKKNEVGYLEVSELTVNGNKTATTLSGTILEIALAKPIFPNSTSIIKLNFKGQIPKQIRRSGRNNKEGIALSMTQWYPKIAAYDNQGWHADPYIGREFYGVFGNYDVKIALDSAYTIAGTGILQNPQQIGHGYNESDITTKKTKKLNWHFKAEKVHDFAWAADPNYIHDTLKFGNNQKLHFFYKNEKKYLDNWKKLQPIAMQLMSYYNSHIGAYPYPQYSIIQGGDGGMEYAMCTLITGDRKFRSLVGVTAHEMAHAWFQHILATNEAKYEWMDEGFTTYISSIAEKIVLGLDASSANEPSYNSYNRLATSDHEQPQTTHADRYTYNFAYGVSAYSKGAIFLSQLGYIIGEDNLKQTIKAYYNLWKFKHPKPNDFKRIAENISGIQLDWYLTDWTQTTHTIDYGIRSVNTAKKNTAIVLERIGNMPMPIEVKIDLTDGSSIDYYIPLPLMRGEKKTTKNTKILKDWPWAFPTYQFEVSIAKENIKLVTINPSKKMADINPLNDTYKK